MVVVSIQLEIADTKTEQKNKEVNFAEDTKVTKTIVFYMEQDKCKAFKKELRQLVEKHRQK